MRLLDRYRPPWLGAARRSPVVLALCLAAIAALGPSSALAADPAVKIVDFGFEPATITVRQGEAVIWTNGGSRQHTVTADDGSFDGGNLGPGDPYGNVFDTAGTFTYHCAIHPDRMKGTVVVTAVHATPAPSGATPPPGTLPPDFRTPVTVPSVAASEAAPAVSPEPDSAAGSTSAVILPIAVALALAALLLAVLARRRRP